jgi:hypothetical protein
MRMSENVFIVTYFYGIFTWLWHELWNGNLLYVERYGLKVRSLTAILTWISDSEFNRGWYIHAVGVTDVADVDIKQIER